jgi:hypothetical protein
MKFGSHLAATHFTHGIKIDPGDHRLIRRCSTPSKHFGLATSMTISVDA